MTAAAPMTAATSFCFTALRVPGGGPHEVLIGWSGRETVPR
ncbi:hypothetical protein SEA_LASTHOPE_42 [Mycobacterium phage LastHope]|uniref:Uncharacterized protein n=1 Tax=Mycobacterium phage LastHope TaxID=2015886 RepID=A0A222ZT98_9CAUD|nr:hypothetical protein I5G99_gp066 [Mycobacterium phage LastHope]ASR87210.1 hypothetical protein SEA_LASTHOPE_42 [Mycobacterium phage LastHope]